MTAYGSVPGLRVEADGPVLRLVLDRPRKRNAIDDAMMMGLVEALDSAGRDDEIRVIELSGTGDDFCGGADIVARNRAGEGRPRVGSIQRRVPSLAHRLIPLMVTVQTPIVCRVQGWATGIGFHLALAADFTVADEEARFWEPFLDRGFTPDSGATWMLPRLVGLARTRELLLLSRKINARQAEEWGAIHAAVPASELDAVAGRLVEQLADGPTVALGLTKWLLHASADASLDQQLRDEAFALELSSRSPDFREGLAAFREKRPPDFGGR